MSFLKTTLAVVIGVIVALVAIFFVSVMLLFSATSASTASADIRPGSVLVIPLSGTLVDRPTNDALSRLSGEDDQVGLYDVIRAIRAARDNDNVCGIWLKAGDLTAGFAAVEELRAALADFRTTGKFVTAYSDIFRQGVYHLCSVADRVALNPEGGIEWVGLASAPLFYKDLLSKLGVEMQVFKVGTYKSAVEPYTATAMSDANREQLTALLTGIWDRMKADVAEGRGLTVDQVNTAAERVPYLLAADESLAMGLADTLVYRIDVEDMIKAQAGVKRSETLHQVTVDDMLAAAQSPKDKSGHIVALYFAEGSIVTSDTGYSPLSGGSSASIVGNTMAADLDQLRQDDDVRAVVIRVNSPGGSAYASEQIWHAIDKLRAVKPVVVSMGDYAASGGYYISCNAPTIVADANTLTGSIGIFGLFPNLQRTADMVGLDFDVVKTNTYADFGLQLRPMTEGERALMQAYINRGYDTFLTRCAEGRGRTKEEIDAVGQGRVWSGNDAIGLGLVDEIGGLGRAIEIAATEADVDAYTLMTYPEEPTMWESLRDLFDGFVEARTLRSLGPIGDQLIQLRAIAADPVQARMPYDIKPH